MSGPSQPKVFDEDWSDDRVKSFLTLQPYDETPVDFYRLIKAYQAMVLADFKRFVTFFTAAGGDINQSGPDGRNIFDVIKEHGRSEGYASCLQQAGASTAA
ncbi:MAG: PA4642 family protein [Hahellaceae bacterium]|jgi:hypothetical protein|nr:PA4642 family protein [Hahellaceae bacterium]MCP5210083.1 PA4642 family protein [Hahellaceae bacterium]